MFVPESNVRSVISCQCCLIPVSAIVAKSAQDGLISEEITRCVTRCVRLCVRVCARVYETKYQRTKGQHYMKDRKKTIFKNVKNRFEQIEFLAKLLDDFLRCNKRNIIYSDTACECNFDIPERADEMGRRFCSQHCLQFFTSCLEQGTEYLRNV